MEWFIQYANAAECILLVAMAVVGLHFRQSNRITRIETALTENIKPLLQELRYTVAELPRGARRDTDILVEVFKELERITRTLQRLNDNLERLAPKPKKAKRIAKESS